MSRAYTKYWVFTKNNPPGAELEGEQPTSWRDVEYVVWQEEQGENGTRHWQGYVVFQNPKKLTWIKSNCDGLAHFEPRKGSHEQAKAYCTKQDTRILGPWEGGDEPPPSEQGKRNDLISLKRKMDQGVSELQVAEDEDHFATWAKHWKALQRYQMLKRMGERKWHTFCQVYWGPSGSGKSRRALEEAGEGAYWLSKPSHGSTLWFDGYEGQETVVIDEFYGWIQRDMLQRMCDRYPLLVQTKGGTTPFIAKKIIITSNDPPVRWWPKVGLGAMTRRLQGDQGAVTFVPLPEDLVEPPAHQSAEYWEAEWPKIAEDVQRVQKRVARTILRGHVPEETWIEVVSQGNIPQSMADIMVAPKVKPVREHDPQDWLDNHAVTSAMFDDDY